MAPPWRGLLWRPGAGWGFEPPPAGSSLGSRLNAHPHL